MAALVAHRFDLGPDARLEVEAARGEQGQVRRLATAHGVFALKEAFGELDCAAGIFGRLRGTDVMPVLLNAADRPLFLGSRPTPFDGADGYPSLLEPLS